VLAGRLNGRGDRIAGHLEDTVDEVEDPVVRDASARVEGGFRPAVVRKRRIYDLDQQRRPSRLSGRIVPMRSHHHRHVGFRF